MWTGFTPPQIFASCSQLSTPINTSAYQLGLTGNSLVSKKCEFFSKRSNCAKMLKPTLSFQSSVLSPLSSHHGKHMVFVVINDGKTIFHKNFSGVQYSVMSYFLSQ
jgi:hypothetical protein